MPRTPAEDLPAFVRRQPAVELATVLLELAEALEPVRRRLERMQLASRPDKLAAAFRSQLSGWKRSTRYVGYAESREFGRTLESWLDQVARELQPLDPPAALALFEAFIEADAKWFERADDSDGAIGDAVRSACEHWLGAAAQCETPRSAWPERLMRLYDADEYGAREALLRHADQLLDEAALRALADGYEARLRAVVARSRDDGARLPMDVFRLSGALTTLAEALRDPDVHARALLAYSPQPNELQKERLAQAYLDAERPAQALQWLDGPWQRDERMRRRMVSDALVQLGRLDECAAIRQELFESSLSTLELQRWLACLPESRRQKARERAHGLALEHADAVVAAALLLELDDPAGAEGVVVRAADTLDGHDYGSLVPLCKALRSQGRARGEAAVLRALMGDILARARSKAYGHAARYLRRLREIDASGERLDPLTAHAAFEQDLRARHARKAAFWTQVAQAGDAGTEDGPSDP